MKRKILLVTIFICALMIAGCTKVYEKTDDKSFKVIKNIKGLTFDVYSPFLDNCSFSTGILETDQLNNGTTYVYRNDTTDYMIYNSKSFGVVAQKIDSLGLNESKKTDVKVRLSNLYFLNTSVTSKASAIKFKYDESGDITKYITSKPIEVGIAPNVLSFQNYYGYLSYIERDNKDAFVIFAGTINPIEEVDNDVREKLYHIVASMVIDDNNIGLTDVSENDTSFPAVTFEGVKEEEVVEAVVEEPIPEPIEAITKTDSINVDIKTSAYNKTQEESVVNVCIKSVNRRADDFIKAYEKDYFEVKDGCHFEMVEYELKNPQTEDDYVRFNLVGLDAEKLVYNGIKYSKRTYELTKGKKTYVYYEVPNGCKEYMLEIGGLGEKGYFHVKPEEEKPDEEISDE